MDKKRKFDNLNSDKIDIDNLVSATRLANYIRNDPIIDYLDTLDKNKMEICEDTFQLKNKNTNVKKRKTSFDYIVEEGYKFEEKIVKKIKNLMTENNLQNKIITIEKCEDINEHFKKTKKIIEQHNFDVILGGILINISNMTYGYPDIIVSGAWINKFISSPPQNIEQNIYYIIDIKSSTINLINGGKYVSCSNLIEGYKTQIWVYKEALNQIQKCQSNYGFIMGKKYKYIQDNKEIHIKNSFYTLGFIDYIHEKDKGNDIKHKISKAVKWNKELRKNWRKYKLYPICKKIRPNMKNSFDKNYKKIKKNIANKNNELTLLWNCGIAQRNNALKSKITKYSDPKLTPEKLGINEDSAKYNIINSMLSCSHNDELILLNKNNNYGDWQKKTKYEFFVDFETYIPTLDESLIYENEEPDETQCIYMIGVGYLSSDTTDVLKNQYIFKCFIIQYHGSNLIYKKIHEKYKCNDKDIIQVPNEKILIENFINYIYSFKRNDEPRYRFVRNTRLIHWSWAEPCLFAKKLFKYNMNSIVNNLPWFDLMKVFKDNTYPIIIKNCFSFSLKEITKTMNSYKMINLTWPDLDDGLLSAFIAKDIYKKINLDIDSNNNNMQDIVEYNYIDCKALYLILTFIRNHLSNIKNITPFH
jgi:hypothetical protein